MTIAELLAKIVPSINTDLMETSDDIVQVELADYDYRNIKEIFWQSRPNRLILRLEDKK